MTDSCDETSSDGSSERALLAVDLGLRCGMACFGGDGRLVWYRSQHFGSRAALKRAIYGILRPIQGLDTIVLEGDRALAELWAKLARKWGVEVVTCGAEAWRDVLLLDRQQTCGAVAKHHADHLARSVITWSGAPEPTSLRHDAAEAILIGLWGVHRAGWLEAIPELA